MGMISLKCPDCRANIDLSDDREFGFCQYCGTKVLIKEFIPQKSIIDESGKIPGLLELSESALHSNEYTKCIDYAEQVIIIQSNNDKAWYLKGCALAASGNEQCIYFWKKALDYAEEGSEIYRKATNRLNDPSKYIKKPTKKFKVQTTKAPTLLQPTLHFYFDNKEVMAVKGGCSEIIDITQGKHKLSIRVNHRTFKSFKQEILVDEKDVVMKFTWDKKINNYKCELDF